MDNLILKRIQSLQSRLTYIQDIFAGKHQEDVRLLDEKLRDFTQRAERDLLGDPYEELATVEGLFKFVEE